MTFMSYTLGIGALIEGPAFNTVRDIELKLALKTENFRGFSQPPHITIKRPFEVLNEEGLHTVMNIMDKVTANGAAFDVTLGDYGNFDSHALYAVAKDGQTIMELHQKLMSALALLKIPPDPFEGDSLVFHTPFAKDLTKEEFAVAESELKALMEEHHLKFKITQLGLFMGLDEGTHWPVIKKYRLGT